MATIPKEFAEYLFILQQWRPTHKEWNERKLSEAEKEGHSFQKQNISYFLYQSISTTIHEFLDFDC